jgi:TM2 domain-containing membrane protein YozV
MSENPGTAQPEDGQPGFPGQQGHPGPQAYPGQPGYPAPNLPAPMPMPQQPYGMQPQYGQPPMMVAARKEPAVMLIASFFIPGLGTILNGEGGKGAAILIGWLVSWILFWLLAVIIIGFLFLPVSLALWIWGMVDAYTGAKNFNIRNGYPA